MRIEWAMFHRRISRCQSPGNAFEFHCPKRRLSGPLTTTVIARVAKDKRHASVSNANDTELRQSVSALIDAPIGMSIRGGMNFDFGRVKCWRIRTCAEASSFEAAGTTTQALIRNIPATSPVVKTSPACARHIIGVLIRVSTHSSHDIKTTHHRMVFMLQIVAVQHISPAKLPKTKHHQHLFTSVEGNSVFPAPLMEERGLAISLFIPYSFPLLTYPCAPTSRVYRLKGRPPPKEARRFPRQTLHRSIPGHLSREKHE